MMELHRQDGRRDDRFTKLVRRLSLAICVSLGVGRSGPLHAQDYPSRPIQIIVPFSPGGAVDGPTRIVAQELRNGWTSRSSLKTSRAPARR